MTLLAVTGLLREARIARQPGVSVLAGGGDAQSLAGRIERLLHGDVRGLISIGIGGGLAPALRTGDVVIGQAVLARSAARMGTAAAWTQALREKLPQAVCGDIFGSDIMLTGAPDKAALFAATGALAVDMESHVVAAAAAKAGLPFAVLRVIADPAARGLPRAVTAGMKADGRMNIGGVLKAVAADPRQIPSLIRAGFEAEAALRGLLRCRGALGGGLGFPDFHELVFDVT